MSRADFENNMPEDFLKTQAIEGIAAATEHVRHCEQCRRVYGAAFDIVRQERAPYLPNPWRVYMLPELHLCERWPKGI